jgi:hypothetical protein
VITTNHLNCKWACLVLSNWPGPPRDLPGNMGVRVMGWYALVSGVSIVCAMACPQLMSHGPSSPGWLEVLADLWAAHLTLWEIFVHEQ